MTDDQFVVMCIVCGETCSNVYDLYDDRYGYQGLFPLAECASCGHKMLHVSMSRDQIADLYTNYYPRSHFRFEDYKPYKEISGYKAWLDGAYRSAFRWVPRNVRVLDIGCGFGETLGYHKERGCDVYGVEADENVRRVAKKNGFNVHVGLFDPDIYQHDFFDYVTMDQVIEHVSNPVETLMGIARVLKPGGVAILSTPNANGWGARFFGRRWINWHAPYHIHHFSLNSMNLAARQAGLLVERTKAITSSDWLNFQWLHLATYPQMGNPSPFWTPGCKLDVRTALLFRLLSFVHWTKINHVITRLFDWLGMGDNYLFFLKKHV